MPLKLLFYLCVTFVLGQPCFCLHKVHVKQRRNTVSHICFNVSQKRKGTDTAGTKAKRRFRQNTYLSPLDFLANIERYVDCLSQEDCYVSIDGKARKCRCLHFLANKPSVIKSVALGMQMYFDLDEPKRKLMLANEQRHAN